MALDHDKVLHALKTVRCDLAWASDHIPEQSLWRIKSGIRIITNLLDDESEFEKLKQRWEKETPGIIQRLYDPYTIGRYYEMAV